MPKTRSERPHNLEFIHRDRGYRFTERDPKMVELCALVHESELSTWAIAQKVANMTAGAYKVSPNTIDKWLDGRTRRPQAFTMTWVGYALGYELTWKKV